MDTEPIVLVVDDDRSVRKALRRLLRSAQWHVETFASAHELLDREPPARPSCLVLDVRMPGLSGLDLQAELLNRGFDPAIVFLTGHATVPMSVRAMKIGAVDFLQKPFDEEDLFAAIRRAVQKDAEGRELRAELGALRERHRMLTAREGEIFSLVTAGLLNKQIAGRLGISEKTVKVHRGRVMAKMNTGSLVQLVRMADKLGERIADTAM